MVSLNTRVIDLTLGELLEALANRQQAPVTIQEQKPKEKWLVYGMDGLAKLFGCSKVKAWEIKKSGIIDKAVSQTGRTIVVDAEKALELVRNVKVKLR